MPMRWLGVFAVLIGANTLAGAQAAKVASIPLPAAKWRVMKAPGQTRQDRTYCWMDAGTVLWLHRGSTGESGAWEYTTQPPQSRYERLLATLRTDHSGSFMYPPEMDTVASGRYFCIEEGHSSSVFGRDGRVRAELTNYHTDIAWSPSGDRIATAYIGRNGHILTYPVVRLGSPLRQHHLRSIENRRPNTIVAGTVAMGLAAHDLRSLSLPAPHAGQGPSSGVAHLWLASRNVERPRARTSRRVVRLPIPGHIEGAVFCQDGTRYAVLVSQSGADGPGYLCVGSVTSGSLRPLVRFASHADASERRVKWKPNSHAISFVYQGWLYAMPVR